MSLLILNFSQFQEMNSQELVLPEDYEEAAVAVNNHPEIEVMAQSICTAITGFSGWTYAVQRVCTSSSTVTCNNLCKSPHLRSQDRQTRSREWRAAAAIHVYRNRPSSSPGTAAAPHIGMKVFRYGTIHGTGCGPNFCCCHVPVWKKDCYFPEHFDRKNWVVANA